MSMSVVASVAPPVEKTVSARIGVLLLIVAHLPLTAAYFVNLSSLPHYQFFPLALIGSVLLARRAHQPAARRGCSVMGVGCVLTCGLLCLLIAVTLDSPWLGAASTLFSYAAWLRFGCCGSWASVLPPVVMAATTLRLPMGIDVRLINELQRITAHSADAVLDVLGILHTLSGNVIAVPGRQLLIEEACSGVNSLFAATASLLFCLLWSGRGLLSSCLLLVSVPLWVVVANVLRVVAVAVLRVRWGIAADEGLLHDLLGFSTFLIAIGFIFSTERLLRFYAVLVEAPATPGVAASPQSMSSGRRLWTLAGGAAAIIALLQVPALAARVDHYYSEWRSEPLAEWGGDALPQQIGPWRCSGYEVIERDRNSPFGRHSQLWTYLGHEQTAIVSVDYPFHGWHELVECYVAQGWEVEAREVVPTGVDQDARVDVRLRHAAGNRYARLLFLLTTRDGRAVPIRRRGEVDEWLDRAEVRLRALVGGRAGGGSPEERATYQFQWFSESYVPATAEADAAVVQLFAATVEPLRRSLAPDSAFTSTAGGAP